MIAHTFHMYSSLPYTTAWFSLSNFSPSCVSTSIINPRKELSGVWANHEEQEKQHECTDRLLPMHTEGV